MRYESSDFYARVAHRVEAAKNTMKYRTRTRTRLCRERYVVFPHLQNSRHWHLPIKSCHHGGCTTTALNFNRYLSELRLCCSPWLVFQA